MIDFPAVRHRRKIGTIRFHQDAVGRGKSGRFAHMARVFIGNDPGKRKIPATANQIPRHLGTAAVAVENALYAGMAADSRKGIAVRFPVMNDHRQGQFPGKGQLRLKKRACFSRSVSG